MDPKTYGYFLDLFAARIERCIKRGDHRSGNGIEITIFATSDDYDAAEGYKRYGVQWSIHCQLCGDLVAIFAPRGYDIRLVIGDSADDVLARETLLDAMTLIRSERKRRDKARAEVRKADNALRAATLAALTAGVPVKDAAREAGVSRQTVHKWRDKGGGHD